MILSYIYIHIYTYNMYVYIYWESGIACPIMFRYLALK